MTTRRVSIMFALVATLWCGATKVQAQDSAATKAVPPGRLSADAKLFVPQTDFGMALSAAILKKRVPVIVMADSTKADFFVRTVSAATKESGGERVTKLLLFGAGAGSGKHFEASVTITNRDGAIVFAHNSKKGDFQSAAQNVASEIKKQIEKP